MHINSLSIVLCACAIIIKVEAKDEIVFKDTDDEDEGHYWRDYNGVIPKDALPGGKTVSGKTTYIGQVLYREQLIPAKIETDPKLITYEWGYQEFIATENIKILCTRNRKNYQWFATKFTTFLNDIKDKVLVSGGYEVNAKLYIGRTDVEGELAVGKVISTKLQTTLNTTKNGKGFQHGSFEVLEYNRTIPGFDLRSGVPCNVKAITMNIFNIV